MVRRSVRRFSSLGMSTSSPELQHPDLLPSEPTPTPTPLSMESERPRRSVRSSVRGRATVLSSWLKASPMTTSFIEDAYEGTSKLTRMNTLYNRYDISRLKHIQASQSGDFSVHSISSVASDSASSTSSSDPTLSPPSPSSSASMESTTSSLKFVDKARVFHQNSRLEDDPIFEDLKKPNRLPPLEVRRYRASRHYPLDPSQPCTGAGRWLQSKRSS